MIDPVQLNTLVAIHETGSFDAAARRLNLTQSAISQRIKALEERFGAALIERGTPCRATPLGARLIRHRSEVGLLEQALANELGLDAAQTTLRIAVNADSLATWILPALTSLPDVSFDMVVDDQDNTADRLRRGTVSAAVSADPAPVMGCDSIPLGALRYRATASPAFVARHLSEDRTDGFATAPMLIYDRKDKLQSRWLLNQTGRELSPPSHYIPSTTAFVEAALIGLGWGLNPAPLVDDLIAKGALIDLSPDTETSVDLYWQVNRVSAKPLAPLTAAIKQAAARVLK